MHSYPPILLDLTFDQLRTLLMVHAKGSALRAARSLGREQSSVQKQLDSLNRHFQALCGETLVARQGRGQDFLFTATGEEIVEIARRTLDEWRGTVDSVRRRVGSTLTVGTTEFALHFLSAAVSGISGRFAADAVEFRVTHVRTRDFWANLEAKDVDLLIGTVVAAPGEPPGGGAYDTIELRRGTPALLTNLPPDAMPEGPIGLAELPEVPLLLPGAGLVADLLSGWYGPDYRSRLTIAAEIADLRYGTELLRSGLVDGCLVVPRGLAWRMRDQAEADGLRVVALDPGARPPLEVVSAVFARRGERNGYAPDHPLNLLWEALRAEAARGILPG